MPHNRPFKKMLNKWFGNRMPIADSIKLQQRSTYILPTKAGMFMAAVVMLMMIGATNYQNNLAFLLTFMIASIGLVSILMTFNNLQGLIFKLGPSASVSVGEFVHITSLVLSQSGRAHMTIGAGFSKEDLYFLDVDSAQGNSFVLSLKATKRGWLYPPRMMATSSFPFGLLRVWSWFRFSSPILIYPKPVAPPTGSQKDGSEEEESQYIASGVDDLYGLKSYQVGDPVSRIDWKAEARGRGLFSKEFVSYQSQDFVFDWNDFKSADDELKLSYLCYLVKTASRSNFEYALRLPKVTIAKNSGEDHQRKCLRSLALF